MCALGACCRCITSALVDGGDCGGLICGDYAHRAQSGFVAIISGIGTDVRAPPFNRLSVLKRFEHPLRTSFFGKLNCEIVYHEEVTNYFNIYFNIYGFLWR